MSNNCADSCPWHVNDFFHQVWPQRHRTTDGIETVLIVEDEAQIRGVLHIVLSFSLAINEILKNFNL